MAQKLYEESNIINIGRALQSKLNTSSSFSVAGMASAVLMINSIPTLQILNCSRNGDYVPPSGVDGFNYVIVSVPASPSASLITKSISFNGTYLASSDGADGFSQVVISVPAGTSANLSGLSVSINGTYTPSGNIDGFDNVVVDVDVTRNLIVLSVSSNGIYILEEPSSPSDPIGFDQVFVSVPTSPIPSLGNCLSGISVPTSEIGNIGDLYIQKTMNFRYFRLTITKVRTSGSGCQFSRLCINLYGDDIVDDIVVEDINGEIETVETIITQMFYPKNARIHCNKIADNASHLVQNLIDCNSSRKFYTSHNPTINDPIVIEVDMGDALIHKKEGSYDWSFYTADDKPECDPVSFIVQISSDGQTWITVDQQTDYDLPTTRNSENYHKDDFNYNPSDYFIRDIYMKKNSGWTNVLGANVNA